MKTPNAILLILLFVSGIFSSCKKHFTFTGTVIDAVTNQGIGNAVIRFNVNPSVYPFDDDSFEVVGSSGSDGHFSVDVQTEYDFGYLVAEHGGYWCPAPMGIDQHDTLHMFRDSWLMITLHDDPYISSSGLVSYNIQRTFPSTLYWFLTAQNVEANEREDNIPAADGKVLMFRLAGDWQNDLYVGLSDGNSLTWIDTLTQVTPGWGDTLKFDVNF